MKKFGFTLAEVLITLGIIGVVAALTAPALVMQSRDQANAAKLAVTVSNLENAFTTALSAENVDSLFRTSIWQQGVPAGFNRNAFVGNLKRYINVSDWRDMTPANYYAAAGGAHEMTAAGGVGAVHNGAVHNGQGYDMANDWDVIIETKQGATIIMRPFRTPSGNGSDGIIGAGVPLATFANTMASNGGGLTQRAANVMIDVNGTAAPNTWGRDIFFFILSHRGILYPMGGLDTSVYMTGAGTSIWSSEGWAQCYEGHYSTGLGCAGRVVADGYRIDY